MLLFSLAMVVADSTVAPLGFFVTAPGALGDPSALLADNIDPQTRDYLSLFTGADPIEAQVQLAMTTIRASGSAVTEDGIDPTPTKMTTSYKNELTADARLALRRLVQQGDIRIVEILFDIDDESQQTSQIRVRWLNLRIPGSDVKDSALPVPGRIV